MMGRLQITSMFTHPVKLHNAPPLKHVSSIQENNQPANVPPAVYFPVNFAPTWFLRLKHHDRQNFPYFSSETASVRSGKIVVFVVLSFPTTVSLTLAFRFLPFPLFFPSPSLFLPLLSLKFSIHLPFLFLYTLSFYK